VSLKDTYDRLKNLVVGVKTSSLDTKLDIASREISLFRTHASMNSYIDLVKNLISQAAMGSLTTNQPLMGFGQVGVSPAALGQGLRIMRYKTYESIVNYINYCFRALNVIVDNIISPDDITKVSIEVKSKKFLQEHGEEAHVELAKQVIDKLEIERYLSMLVKNTLKFGDFFCEIADSKTALISKSIVTEDKSVITEEILTNRDDTQEKDIELVEVPEKINNVDFKFRLDFSLLSESKSSKKVTEADEPDGSKKSESKKLNDLKLLFYEPRQIVKLQSEAFPICFGYLVFPLVTVVPQLLMQDQLVNQICASILQRIERKIPEAKNISSIADDLRDLIHTMIAKAGTNFTQINIRYVPPEKMQHFLVPTTKYYPYGESIFDQSQFAAKMMVAMETALVIHRLNRSTEKRKISVEIGLPRDAKKQIEKLKEEMKKRKISLDSFGTVDTIPSMISTFEDVYIPTKDGKAFVDISTFNEGNVETRSKVEELKFIRDGIVAGLGVPPAFVGLEENLSNKSTLSEENVLFARTVIHHQKYLSDQLTDLIKKVIVIVNPEIALQASELLVAFLPPKTLQFERESKYTRDLVELIKTLEEIGIPRQWSKKKYLSGVDWKEIDNFMTDQKIDKEIKVGEEPTEVGMGGLGLGGIGGVGPGTPTMGGF
jgi:hypothetical protein